MTRFSGKRVLVTGSTRGIGLATAERFLAEKAELVVHGRSQDAVNKLANDLKMRFGSPVHGVAADLADPGECQRLADEAGEIDILVNCAGIYQEKPVEEIDDADWHTIVDTNTTAPWILSKALIPGLRKRMGIIVNVSSDAGLLGYARSVVYCASKGALIGLTRALAVELAPDVRVLCVCPGPVETDMLYQAMSWSLDPEAVRRSWQTGTLIGRVAKPEEIAGAIAFAASSDCSFATGNLMVVDGGTTTGRRLP